MEKILIRLNKPPVYLFLSILAMLLLHFILPVYEIIPAPYSYLGYPIIAAGIVVIVWHAGYFHKYDTPIRPFEESTFLIKEGLYKYSRNPIYLGMIVILFGGAVMLGSLTPFIVVPVFTFLIKRNFIVKEEEFLSSIFGKSYIEYKNGVRRWF